MRLSNLPRLVIGALVFVCCTEVEVQAQSVKTSFLESGVTRKVGGYRPIRSVMDQEADIVSVAPEDLEAPRYGRFELGEQS